MREVETDLVGAFRIICPQRFMMMISTSLPDLELTAQAHDIHTIPSTLEFHFTPTPDTPKKSFSFRPKCPMPGNLAARFILTYIGFRNRLLCLIFSLSTELSQMDSLQRGLLHFPCRQVTHFPIRQVLYYRLQVFHRLICQRLIQLAHLLIQSFTGTRPIQAANFQELTRC